ncbi:hypothetical protein MRB53_015748 [Persea americana]|uniref:Uncharacterized protein n=1 Tax=Persea americana TaxID=3435 RepID=A0ACC2M036_PERAE|nr:hypothetical protein MRB53_015748 [Persea americana]
MQYKNLGRSGLKVSLLSYGAWVSFGYQVGFKEAGSLLQCCRDHGVNFFDNAEIFLNGRAEEIMGQAIRELGWKRSDIVIATKIFWGGRGPNDQGLSRKHIVEGTKASLTRLDMDYVDILYCHRPDTATPIEETVRAMNYVIDHGWALYWGTSEWSAQQITEAWAVAQRLDLVGPIVEQPKYNLFHRHKVEVEYQPLYSNYGLGLTTWSPLASGVLTGKYNKGTIPLDSRFALENYKNLASRTLVDDVLRKVDNLKPIADELGVPLSQLAIAWCASNPNVSSVITGATKESQILENMKAIDVIPLLTPQVVEKIEAVVQSKPQCAKLYSSDDDQYKPINIASDVAKRIDLEEPNLVLRQLPFERATTVTIGLVTMPIIVSSTISCVASTAPGVQASIFKDATIPAMVSSGTVSMSGPNHAPSTSGTKIFEEWRTCTEVDRIASARRMMQSSFDFLLQLLDAGQLEMAFNMINLVTDSIAICRDAKLDISEIEATFLQIYNIVEELRQIVTVPAAAYYA